MNKDLKEACEILNSLMIDAEMALCGDWNREDEGFESQINLIENFFNKIGYKYESYESEFEDEDIIEEAILNNEE
jgi:hypothetical protein